MTDIQKKKEKTTKVKNEPKLFFEFNTAIEEKEDSGIFDYKKNENEVIKRKDEATESNQYFCRNGLNKWKVNKYPEQKKIDKDCDLVFFRARKSKNGYYELINPIAKIDSLDSDNLKELNKKMWLLMKSEDNTIEYKIENEPYYLAENDIIKFGQQKYEIIKLNINQDKKKPIEQSEDSNNLNVISQINEDNKKFGLVLNLPVIDLATNKDKNKEPSKEENEKNVNECKVCFGSQRKIEYNEKGKYMNPLLKMCKCNTCIHLSCLRGILKCNKIQDKEKGITKYEIDSFNCEVCNEPYPLYFYVNGDECPKCLIENLEPSKENDYIILESLTHVIEKNKKIVFVITLKSKEETGENDKSFSFGKNNYNDLVDKHLSISTNHAILKFHNREGKVSVTNKGKFGTSVLIKNNIKLKPGQKIDFQVETTYILARCD